MFKFFNPAKRIALVGNAPISAAVLPDIESHDLVIRINAPWNIEGRTDLLVISNAHSHDVVGQLAVGKSIPDQCAARSARSVWFTHPRYRRLNGQQWDDPVTARAAIWLGERRCRFVSDNARRDAEALVFGEPSPRMLVLAELNRHGHRITVSLYAFADHGWHLPSYEKEQGIIGGLPWVRQGATV